MGRANACLERRGGLREDKGGQRQTEERVLITLDWQITSYHLDQFYAYLHNKIIIIIIILYTMAYVQNKMVAKYTGESVTMRNNHHWHVVMYTRNGHIIVYTVHGHIIVYTVH